MDYLQSLLALDGVAIANYGKLLEEERTGDNEDSKPSDSAAAEHPVPDTVRLLLALNAEAEAAATLIAVSASIANALARNDAPRPCPRALTTFAPPEPGVFAASAAHLMSQEYAPELLPALQELFSRMALARQMSRAFAAEAGINSRAPSVDPEALADAWRKACRSAETALRTLKRELNQHGAPQRAATVGLLDLLDVAGRGLHPCVEPDGCVIVPGWAERRQHRRHRTDLEVEVMIGLAVETARVFDVSAGGMGLTGLKTPRRGDAITVKLDTGRRLRGTIAWVAGNKAGMRLQQPLAPGDALLCR
jgi:hypothetical protein